MLRKDSKALISVLTVLAVLCLSLAGISRGQSFAFDGTGRLKVNGSGSSVAVTNQVSVLLTNALNATVSTAGVTNVTAFPFLAGVSNITAVPFNVNATNNTGFTITNVVTTSSAVTNSVTVTDGSGALNVIVDSGTVTVGNSNTFTVNAVQSGTWDEVGINDSGNTITVDGTVAATQSGLWTLGVTNVTGVGFSVNATNNTGFTITNVVTTSSAVTNTVTVTDGSGALNVIVDSSALPSGAALDTTLQRMTNQLDGVTNRQVTAQVSLTTLAGAVSGSEMQVDVITMPTVTVTDGSGALNVIVDSSALPSGAALDTTLQRMTNQIDGITNRLVTLQATMDGNTNRLAALTNYMSPSNVRIQWSPAAGLASNLASSVPFTLTWLSVINTNTSTVFLNAYDAAAVPAIGVTPAYSWIVPYATNGAGFVIPIPVGGQRFTAGLAFWASGNTATNTATPGPIYVNGGGKP